MLAEIRGVAMRWFGERKVQEIWDEEIQWPIGDIQAAHRIRDICRSAADSAERVGRPENGKNKSDAERYENAARAAMEIAMRISDCLASYSFLLAVSSSCRSDFASCWCVLLMPRPQATVR